MTRRYHHEDVLLTALFPLIVISGATNQESHPEIVRAIGQVVSIAAIATAMAVLIFGFPRRIWPLALAGAVVAFRGARLVAPGQGELLDLLYTAVAGLAFGASAALIAVRRPGLLWRQFIWVMALSLPLMWFQLTGAGPWTQVLRTDFHTLGESDLTQYPTLFVEWYGVVATTIQARPAGFMFANNFFSMFVVFALALHYGRPGDRRFSWRDMVLCAAVVLSMAKIAFLAMFVLLPGQMMAKGAGRVRHVLGTVALTVAMLVGYRFLFPGMFAVNMDPDAWVLNFQVRLADFLLATGFGPLLNLADQLPPGALSRLSQEDRQSGYATLVPLAPYIALLAMALAPVFMRGLRWLRRNTSGFEQIPLFALGGVVLAPLGSPFVQGAAFLFFLGVAFVPVWILFEPRYKKFFAQGTVDAKRSSTRLRPHVRTNAESTSARA